MDVGLVGVKSCRGRKICTLERKASLFCTNQQRRMGKLQDFAVGCVGGRLCMLFGGVLNYSAWPRTSFFEFLHGLWHMLFCFLIFRSMIRYTVNARVVCRHRMANVVFARWILIFYRYPWGRGVSRPRDVFATVHT